ncbi:unnamed protein product [Heligmosomoides polygyrus]|uniref:Suppressor of cytokine signaling 5 n=1 Tax=Heligmosomoides polygyrus TaxID=6339 RepID=A0A3P8BDU7_HELPZ|nr:unnamed protein product [Heligmosomoides polygyrus]
MSMFFADSERFGHRRRQCTDQYGQKLEQFGGRDGSAAISYSRSLVRRLPGDPVSVMFWSVVGLAPLATSEEIALVSVLNDEQRPAVHRIVEYSHHLVPDIDKILNASYYWGVMDRFRAEQLLEGKPEGTFLLRDSAQTEYLFSVSFRRYQRTLHARIEQASSSSPGNHRFSFDIHDQSVYSAPTITKLIEKYKDPARCLFFEPQLTHPLHRPHVFSLQELCRGVIVSRTTYTGVASLRLPPKLKQFIREYHYTMPVRTVTLPE